MPFMCSLLLKFCYILKICKFRNLRTLLTTNRRKLKSIHRVKTKLTSMFNNIGMLKKLARTTTGMMYIARCLYLAVVLMWIR